MAIHNGSQIHHDPTRESLRAQPPSQRRETTQKSRCSRPNGADHVVVIGGDDAQAIRKLTDGRESTARLIIRGAMRQ